MLTRVAVALGLALVGVGGSAAWGQDDTGAIVVHDPRIAESSGLAVSPDDPDLLYTLNDSGNDPVVFVIDRGDGSVVGTTTLLGLDPDRADTEALTVEGDTLWVADTGDNLATRRDVALYALPAPGRGDATVTPTAYPVWYPDGPDDVETVLADPATGELWLVTKGLLGGSVMRVPDDLVADGDNRLQPLRDVEVPSLVTDGTVLPGGRAAVLRDYVRAYVYALPGWRQIDSFALPRQEQGESLTALPGGRMLLAGSEGSPARIDRVPLPPAVLKSVPQGGGGGEAPGLPGRDAGSEPTGGEDDGDDNTVLIVIAACAGIAGGLVVLLVSRAARRSSRHSQ